jgi:amino acid permease
MRENLDIDTKTLALYYAWDHFAYHAQQRQTVFNFFLLLIGGCVAAYSSTMGEGGATYNYFRSFLGIVLALASLVFWRLDQRNARLVKISEDALKELEAQIAKEINVPSIRLMANAQKNVSRFPFSKIESFGQIYGLIFAVSGIVGIAMAILSVRG